jgi:hypothetical protein
MIDDSCYAPAVFVHAQSGAPKRASHCGATATTSYALRRDGDNMYCDAARMSYFILLSSLRLVGA